MGDAARADISVTASLARDATSAGNMSLGELDVNLETW